MVGFGVTLAVLCFEPPTTFLSWRFPPPAKTASPKRCNKTYRTLNKRPSPGTLLSPSKAVSRTSPWSPEFPVFGFLEAPTRRNSEVVVRSGQPSSEEDWGGATQKAEVFLPMRILHLECTGPSYNENPMFIVCF